MFSFLFWGNPKNLYLIQWTWKALYIFVAILSSSSYRSAAILPTNLARAEAYVWAKFPILSLTHPDYSFERF